MLQGSIYCCIAQLIHPSNLKLVNLNILMVLIEKNIYSIQYSILGLFLTVSDAVKTHRYCIVSLNIGQNEWPIILSDIHPVTIGTMLNNKGPFFNKLSCKQGLLLSEQ